MRVIDTSVLVAAVDRDDVRHAKARATLADSDPVVIPLPTMTEFLDLLSYRAGRQAATRADADLQGFPHIQVRHAGNPDAVTRLWRAHPELSMADCIGIQACLETGADLLSYDADQLAAMPKR